MPFSPIKITGQEPVLGFNVQQEIPLPDGTPLVVAFDVPPWHWTLFSWSPPRRTVSVSSPVPTNSGIYGPNPPVISGLYGKISGPSINQYQAAYSMKRVLDTGRYYLVVRPQTNPPVGSSVSIAIA